MTKMQQMTMMHLLFPEPERSVHAVEGTTEPDSTLIFNPNPTAKLPAEGAKSTLTDKEKFSYRRPTNFTWIWPE